MIEQVDTRATAGTVTETTYTAGSEKRIVTTSHLGRDRVRALDELGREVMTQTEGLHPVRHVYDPRGRVVAIKEGPEPETSGRR